ncbi:MAG TPA: STAS domain-containing protein [Pyrinomonadaceae bacterium]
MPLRITQQDYYHDRQGAGGEREEAEKTEHTQNLETVLKVQGALYREDAELLERICRDIKDETGRRLRLDLADLAFLDSESASVLCRLKRDQDVALDGLHLFIKKVIELTEAEARAAEYIKEPMESNQHKGERSTKRSRVRTIR